MSAQQGDRAKNYQIAFTEPFLFDRPITAGVDLFIREIRYINQFTQASTGGNIVYGFQVSPFSRVFVNYSLENVKVKDLNPLYKDPRVLAGNPFLADSLLIGAGQHRTISKIGPSYVYNTVDSPITPTTGKRLTASLDVAGIGGNTNFVNPRVEGVWYHALNRRTSLGFRAQAEYITPYGSTVALPIYEKLYLGGEYSMRGFDLQNGRSARPGDRPRAGRQQEPAVQRRIPDQRRRSGPAGAVLRCGPGPRHAARRSPGRKTSRRSSTRRSSSAFPCCTIPSRSVRCRTHSMSFRGWRRS